MESLNCAGKPNVSTTYMGDDKFYCLAAESYADFDNFTKGFRVELALALLSDFLKKIAFAIFGREPNGLRSLTRPNLYNKKSVYAPSRDYSVTPVCSGKNLPIPYQIYSIGRVSLFHSFKIRISRF